MSPLKDELISLRRASARTDAWMTDQSGEFFARGGVCCPYCGVPGYSEASAKQERRETRMHEIIAKLDRDSGHAPRKQWRVLFKRDDMVRIMDILACTAHDAREFADKQPLVTEEGAHVASIRRIKRAI